MKHYPYKADLMREDDCIWWPVSSNIENNMVIGDGIPGDIKSAELCARCCNIAYKHGIKDAIDILSESGIDVSKILNKLIK